MASLPDVWLHSFVVMGCAILVLEDRTAKRRAQDAVVLTTNDTAYWRQYRAAMERMDAALGRPIMGRRTDE